MPGDHRKNYSLIQARDAGKPERLVETESFAAVNAISELRVIVAYNREARERQAEIEGVIQLEVASSNAG